MNSFPISDPTYFAQVSRDGSVPFTSEYNSSFLDQHRQLVAFDRVADAFHVITASGQTIASEPVNKIKDLEVDLSEISASSIPKFEGQLIGLLCHNGHIVTFTKRRLFYTPSISSVRSPVDASSSLSS